MKYTGRILVVLLTLLNYGGWLIYKGSTFRNTSLILFLAYGLLQTVISWWLGFQYDKAKFYSDKDVLTKTYNRRYIYVTFPKLRLESDRNRTKLSVLLLDADKLKEINDVYGHKMGDFAIQHITKVLMKQIRKMDLVARWGGDEFIVIAPDTDQSTAQNLAKRIKNELRTKVLPGTNLPVSVSIGFATYPDDGQKLHELLRIADQRMYTQKKSRS